MSVYFPAIVYGVVLLVGLLVIIWRGSEARTLTGVESAGSPFTRPVVSWLAADTLRVGHLLREGDLIRPAVSPNLAAALPRKERLLGRYVVAMVPRAMPVSPDSLSPVPPALPLRAGYGRVRLPVDGDVGRLLNAGARVWLLRGDTLVTEAEVEYIVCRDDNACFVRALVDSAFAAGMAAAGEAVPSLDVRPPLLERSR